MKKVTQIILFSVIPLIISAQTLSPEIISSAGDYFETTDGSLSWTLGEIMTETYSSGTHFLTQGFQQPVTVRLTMDLQVFLEGPYNGSGMNTWLNSASKLPFNQPYNTPPWNYNGGEIALTIPNNAVDWVLIELRDAANAAGANASKIIARKAGFLMSNGSVTDINGSANLQFGTHYLEDLYVIVWHRNHLGIMSANPPTYLNGIYTYDFSFSPGQVFGGSSGYKMMPSGTWAMVAGDGFHDGLINQSDKNIWTNSTGQEGYRLSDYNMDIQVNNQDKNDLWYYNQVYYRTIP